MQTSDLYADLIATFRRSHAEACHKQNLIKAAERKGPKAIAAAVDTAAKAVKRRDSYARKWAEAGLRADDFL